ncbi:MAG: UDP-N-acetylmuramoyl-tripeptide--D-alanyl-D-alanine ligase [Holosporaceae bacterium]|jgi:UDP-N-acetylmuramoyl-tripeptide--D-alanyl-D-alanine ligase|nr:UDP-N-acetylmuramoyl-tripeptide--D-alanyl-D-alanine ligase [Holosporaceae bacterium]
MKEIFSKAELSAALGQQVKCGISGICINSRDAREGDLFFAMQGSRVDGHDFVSEALKKGAFLAVVEKFLPGIDGAQQILAKASLDKLQDLARYNVSRTAAKYVSVTGSVGKTTTKAMICHFLSNTSRGNVFASKANMNSQIGLPFCVAQMPPDTDTAILEVGMSGAGEIRKLVQVAQPDMAVITAVCESHLESFDSAFGIAKAKSEIFEGTNPPKSVLIPNDSPYTDFLANRAGKLGVKDIYTFGSAEGADAQLLSSNYGDGKICVEARILETAISYELRCCNIALAHNSLIALLASHLVSGIALRDLALQAPSFLVPPGRGEAIFLKNSDILLIDDAYNASPASMKSAIMSLAQHPHRRKIAVLGDMLALGPDSVRLHENLAPTLDKFGIDLVFACGEMSRHLFNNLQEKKKGCWCENSTELAAKLLSEINSGDCLLLKGSHSMRMDIIVDAIRHRYCGGVAPVKMD